MECRPRALGNRSILGDLRVKNMKDIINLKQKKRDEFKPFSTSVLESETYNSFNIDKSSPYMNSVYFVKKNIEKLILAVVNVDKTSSILTVSEDMNIKYYSLIKKFGSKKGISIFLNTLLNVNEPICKNPENTMEVSSKTSIDAIAIQNYVL